MISIERMPIKLIFRKIKKIRPRYNPLPTFWMTSMLGNIILRSLENASLEFETSQRPLHVGWQIVEIHFLDVFGVWLPIRFLIHQDRTQLLH